METSVYGKGSKIALLLHGVASSASTWKTLVNDLLKHDYTVYTPDFPGHGASGSLRGTYNIEQWESLLLDRIEKVDLLIGHSVGGLIALRSRNKLKAVKTVVIDPLLRFPKGPLQLISQEVFGIQQMKMLRSGPEWLRTELAVWDRKTVRMLITPKKIPMPDESVLLIRPKNSFISPLVLMNMAPKMKVVTFKNVGHNLHMEDYPRFFKELEGFALS